MLHFSEKCQGLPPDPHRSTVALLHEDPQGHLTKVHRDLVKVNADNSTAQESIHIFFLYVKNNHICKIQKKI